MIPAQATRAVSTYAGESRTFRIAANGKAFKALISGLYSDKIGSLTREIWSNALDAHVMAGCPERPFEVSFPHDFDPTFRVRDFGVAMTHDEVMDLYTTLFESTKKTTNDQTGKWGLGSKSPFAYTDTFSVTVILDGEKRFYTAIIGSDDLPTINLMGVEPTDEERGVEVSFPVRPEDFRAFRRAAQRVAVGFDVKPVVTNYHDFEGWRDLPVSVEGEGWRLVSGGVNGESGAYARMGPVLYPINRYSVEELTEVERELLTHSLIIDFGMAELEITPSRESLSYGVDDPTNKAIKSRLQPIIDSLAERALKQIAAEPTHWAASKRLAAVVNGLPEAVKRAVRHQARWNGVPVHETIMCKIGSLPASTLTKARRGGGTSFQVVDDNRIVFTPNSDPVILIEDRSVGRVKNAKGRVRQWWHDTYPKPTAYCIRYDGGRQAMNDLVYLLERIDGAKIIDVADLEEPERFSYERGERKPVQVRLMTHYSFHKQVDLSAEEFAAGGLYVPLERNTVLYPKSTRPEPGYMHKLLIGAGAYPPNTPIYGAPKTLWRRFRGAQWVNLYDFADTWMAQAQEGLAEKAALAQAVNRVLGADTFLWAVHRCLDRSRLSPLSVAVQAISFVDDVLGMQRLNVDGVMELAAAMDVEVTIQEHTLAADAQTLEQQVRAAYPLLEVLLPAYAEMVDKITDYVIMCDTASATPNQARAA